MQTAIISDKQVTHRADECGPRIGRVQIVEIDGKQFRCDFWVQWETQRLIRVDSTAL